MSVKQDTHVIFVEWIKDCVVWLKHLEMFILEKKPFEGPHFLILSLKFHRTTLFPLFLIFKNLHYEATRRDLGSHRKWITSSSLQGCLSVTGQDRLGRSSQEVSKWKVGLVCGAWWGVSLSTGLDVRLYDLWGPFKTWDSMIPYFPIKPLGT